MSINMLPDQAGLPMPDSVTPGLSFPFQSDFLGLPLPEEESHWNSKHEQAFTNPNLERDLKHSQVRNGQPTPPPYDDSHSQGIYPPLPQTFSTHSRRSYSEYSGFEDDSYGSSSNSNNHAAKRRKSSRSTVIDHSDRAKREKFLERNRLAASKCRQKKKEHTQQLESQFKEQSEKKERLVAEIAQLRSEILYLKNEVLRHAQCGDEPIKLQLAQMVKKITYKDDADAVSTSEEPVTPTAQQQAPQSQQQNTQQQGVVSFGFDDALQPAALEQQMRRDSEPSLVSQGSSYALPSSEDNFDDLINV